MAKRRSVTLFRHKLIWQRLFITGHSFPFVLRDPVSNNCSDPNCSGIDVHRCIFTAKAQNKQKREQIETSTDTNECSVYSLSRVVLKRSRAAARPLSHGFCKGTILYRKKNRGTFLRRFSQGFSQGFFAFLRLFLLFSDFSLNLFR